MSVIKCKKLLVINIQHLEMHFLENKIKAIKKIGTYLILSYKKNNKYLPPLTRFISYSCDGNKMLHYSILQKRKIVYYTSTPNFEKQ